MAALFGARSASTSQLAGQPGPSAETPLLGVSGTTLKGQVSAVLQPMNRRGCSNGGPADGRREGREARSAHAALPKPPLPTSKPKPKPKAKPKAAAKADEAAEAGRRRRSLEPLGSFGGVVPVPAGWGRNPPELRRIAEDGAQKRLRIHHHRPPGGGPPRGIVVLAPGSMGGMGPGQTPATWGKFNPQIRSVFSLLARQLAADGIAFAHLHWRSCPTRKGAPPGTLKSAKTLREGARDVALAARFLRRTYGPDPPLVLVGFSFGCAAVLAAAATALDGGSGGGRSALGPLAGVVTIAGGLRVGVGGPKDVEAIGDRLVGGMSRSKPREYGGRESFGCVRALARARVPLLLAHGLADVTVDPEASAAIFRMAKGPKALLWLRGADHHSRARFDVLNRCLAEWVAALLRTPPSMRESEGAATRGTAATLPGAGEVIETEGEEGEADEGEEDEGEEDEGDERDDRA